MNHPKYVKKLEDNTDPVWVREGGANYTHSKMSAEAAARLDEPEGSVIVEVSAQLYATMLRIAAKGASTFDPLALRRGPMR